MSKPRLLFADDHPVLLEGVRKLLESNYEVVGTAENGRDLVALAIQHQPDAIVVDIGMPLLNGVEATRQIRERLRSVKIVVLTQQTDRSYVREAFRAGANAYVVKQAAASELMTAIAETLQGRYFVSSMISTAEVQAG